MRQNSPHSNCFNQASKGYLLYDSRGVDYYNTLASTSATGADFLDQCLALPGGRLSVHRAVPALGQMVEAGTANAADVNRLHQHILQKLLPVEAIEMGHYVDFVTDKKIRIAFDHDKPALDWHLGLGAQTVLDRQGDYFAPVNSVQERDHNDRIKTVSADALLRQDYAAASFWLGDKAKGIGYSEKMERKLATRLLDTVIEEDCCHALRPGLAELAMATAPSSIATQPTAMLTR